MRIDVLAERPGPEHCGFQSIRVLITGSSLGQRYVTEADDITYLRDPTNMLDNPQTFDLDAELPSGAVDIGYRSGSTALWIVPGDPSAVYLDAGAVEPWPAGEQVLCE